MKKTFAFGFCLILHQICAALGFLIPMDDTQQNHLKAYGITYWLLQNNVSVDWLLNYRGGSLEGAKIYVSLFPCNECAKAIIQAGIKTIVYECDKYAETPSVTASKRMLDAAGVHYYQYQHTDREIRIML